MLASGCKHLCLDALRKPKTQEHFILEAVLDMIFSSLQELQVTIEKLVVDATSALAMEKSNTQVDENLALAVSNARVALAEQQATCEQEHLAMKDCKSRLAEAKAAEKDAAASATGAAAKEKKCVEAKKAVEQGLKLLNALEADGVVKDGKKQIKELEAHIKSVNAADTLFAST